MRLRPLIIGTFLAVCFWGVSMLWKGAGNVPLQNNAEAEINESNDLPNDRVDLLVTFEGSIDNEGQLVIQLYRDAESFESRKMPLDECFLKLDISDETLWQFRGLPKGEYAVIAFHDANENWQLDRSAAGPRVGKFVEEKITFSQLGHSTDLNPTFDQCKFPVSRNQVIRLKWH